MAQAGTSQMHLGNMAALVNAVDTHVAGAQSANTQLAGVMQSTLAQGFVGGAGTASQQLFGEISTRANRWVDAMSNIGRLISQGTTGNAQADEQQRVEVGRIMAQALNH